MMWKMGDGMSASRWGESYVTNLETKNFTFFLEVRVILKYTTKKRAWDGPRELAKSSNKVYKPFVLQP